MDKKKEHKEPVKQLAQKELADRIAGHVEKNLKRNPNANPFNGLKLSDEDRRLLAEAGIV